MRKLIGDRNEKEYILVTTVVFTIPTPDYGQVVIVAISPRARHQLDSSLHNAFFLHNSSLTHRCLKRAASLSTADAAAFWDDISYSTKTLLL
jgi:hypothetical protein